MESVSFKIYLEKGDGSSEIRRFCIDESSAGTFECIKQKIRQLYPSLQDAEFFIFWKDNENDKIAVNCDTEYIVAITTIREEVRDDIVRLYCSLADSSEVNNASAETSTETKKAAIRYTPEELKALNSPSVVTALNSRDANKDDEDADGSSGGEAAAAAKPTVTFAPGTLKGLQCGSCLKSLDGKLLFKCVTCPNYDLCASCVKQSHLEHVMIRIPSQQALMRSGIFVVDRLNKLARRRSHTSRFDFSALIVPLADNYKVTHFRKMKDAAAAEVVTATNCGAGAAAATFYAPNRKAAKRLATAAVKGGFAAHLHNISAASDGRYPISIIPTSHPHAAALRRSASFVADERRSRGGEERKSKGDEGDKEKQKEKEKEKERLKRSRSLRREGGERGAMAAAQSVLDYWLPPALSNTLAGTPAEDVMKGVTDFLAGINISCPSEQQKKPAPAGNTQPQEEAKKRKVPTPTVSVEPIPQMYRDLFKDVFKAQLEENGLEDQAKANAAAKPDSTTPDKKEDKASAAPAPQQQQISSSVQQPAATAPPRQDDNDGIRVRPIAAPRGADDPDVEDWMLVDPAAQGAIPRRPPPPQQQSVYPSTSEIPHLMSVREWSEAPPSVPVANAGQGEKARPTELQERVSAALNKMLAMGFTNEGGWLENLLNNHDGSIERVLEILLPTSVFGRVIA
ncbi:hypothetical protein LSTR_LSTR003520 [Laodelphax striatellus]|uniref:ZZ-type domain-containing protein n=1 Tax=Laodelphax striatellus TaxID=195883 RepID=A0A482X7W0_LAOST|nr:hypothetical protein LSTR_LSTR003520 [Laodelphax striatellus]